MATIAAIGSEVAIGGYAMTGVLVLAAEDPGQVRQAWQRLPADVHLVILTASAAEALDAVAHPPEQPLIAVMP